MQSGNVGLDTLHQFARNGGGGCMLYAGRAANTVGDVCGVTRSIGGVIANELQAARYKEATTLDQCTAWRLVQIRTRPQRRTRGQVAE